MRDAIFSYGTTASATISPTTKDTDYYVGGAIGTVYIDLGSISTGSRFTRHTLDRDLNMVWRVIGSTFNANDYIIPFLEHADEAAFNATQEYAWVGSPTKTGTAWPAGTKWTFRAPERVRRYIAQGLTAKSSGSYTACTFEAYFEHGTRGGYDGNVV